MRTYKATERRLRSDGVTALGRDVRELSKHNLLQFGPDLLAFINTVAQLSEEGKISADFLQHQTAHLKNNWREGNAIHGRRYPHGIADTVMAVGLHAQRRQSLSLCALMSANPLCAIPSRFTLR